MTDSTGNVIALYTPNKLYQSVVISTPKLTKGATYTLTCGTQTAKITLSSVATSIGQQGMGGGQGGGPGQGGGMQKPGDDTTTSSDTKAKSN